MLRVLSALAVLACVYAFAVESAESSSGGAPAGFAGDFENNGVPQTCSNSGCHATFGLNSGSGDVTVHAPASVAPGETVRITVSVDNQTDPASPGSRRQGFQAIVKDPASGEAVGSVTLVDAENTRFAGFRAADTVYVTHTSAGTGLTSWAFDWTAPTTDVPADYRVYVAGNAANGNSARSGDYIYTTTANIASGSVSAETVPEAVRFDLSAPRPHPISGATAHVEVSMDVDGDLDLTIVDGLGRHVRRVTSDDRGRGTHRIPVEVAGLAPGMYFLVATGPGGRRTQPMGIAR